ncbi:formylglycine-generating enzyme family protein [Candidatus Marithioploca araucensis]|uniref:Formylglycine-generating enzyme family protein n=1 Tax=Candidatus Marithioploca araucensis TaxID=70273 RepID=A0ABT7VRL1_9GAMM|nr:formylglycine-generating enzyme family protein [Candidatus Marithioploca araucensis]
MLETFLSISGGFNTLHETYQRISGIFKADKNQQYLERIASGIERLSETILYAPSQENVIDVNQSHQRKINSLKEVKESLEPVQRAVGGEILSSAMIWTPEKMQNVMREKGPWEVLADIRPLALSKAPNNPDMIPILFEHQGLQYIGWQMRGVLPIMFDCQYDELWVPETSYEIKRQPGELFSNSLKDGSKAPEMVIIPAGEFRMGDILGTGGDYEKYQKPVHHVSVECFAMGRYPVTVGEFRSFVKATRYKTEAEKGDGAYVWKDNEWKTLKDANWRNPYLSQTDNHPVVCVSWNDAVAYTEWLSKQTGQAYRLPSEAEWEYAARAGTETDYWWGNEIGDNQANCYNSGSQWSNKSTSPIGSFKANPFGLFDTVGNVWEWCADNWHENYEGAPTDGTVWKGGDESLRVLRGGSWDVVPDFCRRAYRSWGTSDLRYQDIGFRVAARL